MLLYIIRCVEWVPDAGDVNRKVNETFCSLHFDFTQIIVRIALAQFLNVLLMKEGVFIDYSQNGIEIIYI